MKIGIVLIIAFGVAGCGGTRKPPAAPAAPVAVQCDDGQINCRIGSNGTQLGSAIAKCTRWGYAPVLRALHEACVRMVRADYGGTGESATRDGTRIEFCDRAGIHGCPEADGRLEAVWSAAGAICVAQTRISELAALDQLAARYPRLAGHLGPAACTAASASDAALLSFRLTSN